MVNDLVVDVFCGGGGTSLGIEWAIGRSPDIAINHDDAAIEMHAANHPKTLHVREDVWKADLRKLTRGRHVGLITSSPSCTHFSRAKGGKPLDKNIRSLAWIVCKWAEEVKPAIIVNENVHEMTGWGPLVPRYACRECDWKGTEGQAKLARVNIRCPRCNAPRLRQLTDQFPDPDRKGLTFKRWVGRLRNLGYAVEWKVLNAADYGAPTHRKRLFVIARRDGLPIIWPEPTHCDPKKLEDMPLFGRLEPWRTAAECIDWDLPCPSIFERKRPLKEATLRRIALGIKRYVIEAEEPFIVPVTHSTSSERRCHPLSKPLPTITTAKGGEFALCRPVLGKASAYIAKHFGGMVGVDIRTPLPTTTTKGCQNQLVTAALVHASETSRPESLAKAQRVIAYLIKYFGTGIGQSVDEPLSTITTKHRHALVMVTVAGEPYVIVDIGMRMLTPRELATAQGFPSDYILTGTKTSQVARIGNSVCPHVAKAIVESNYSSVLV